MGGHPGGRALQWKHLCFRAVCTCVCGVSSVHTARGGANSDGGQWCRVPTGSQAGQGDENLEGTDQPWGVVGKRS